MMIRLGSDDRTVMSLLYECDPWVHVHRRDGERSDVDIIKQGLRQGHGGIRCTGRTSAKIGEVGGLEILYHVPTTRSQGREQRFERDDYVGANMAPVIDDQVERWLSRDDMLQRSRIRLIALERNYTRHTARPLAVYVEAIDGRVRKVVLPHVEGVSALEKILFTSDPYFEDRGDGFARVRQVLLIETDVVVLPWTFVGCPQDGESVEARRHEAPGKVVLDGVDCRTWQVTSNWVKRAHPSDHFRPRIIGLCIADVFCRSLARADSPNGEIGIKSPPDT